MKPLLILLVIFLLTACNSRNRTTAAKAVCTSVVNCCKSVKSAATEGCQEKAPSTADELFSVSMHELSKEMLTW